MFMNQYIGDEYRKQNKAQNIKNMQTEVIVKNNEMHILKASFCFSALKLLFLILSGYWGLIYMK